MNIDNNFTVKSPAQASLAKMKEGRSQSGLRAYNERKIMSVIRAVGEAPKSEISKITGSSAQAATVIIKSLEAEQLVIRKEPQRGRVGQPLVPFALNPDGAFGIGLTIGRRSFEMTLIDFLGNVRASLHENFAYPKVDDLVVFIEKGISALTLSLPNELSAKIKGIGIATPNEIWHWAEESGAPSAVLGQWKEFDFIEEIGQISDLPVYVCNDDTAACSAELSFGNPTGVSDFLYIFIGTFIGGGLVINGQLLAGKKGNAGAIGSLPLPSIATDGTLKSQQLIMKSSIHILEKMLADAGHNTDVISGDYQSWGDLGEVLALWIDNVAQGLAYATICSCAIFDFEAVIIDGAIPESVRQKIVERTKQMVNESDLRGLSPINIISGVIGGKAQSIGSANLPLLANYY